MEHRCHKGICCRVKPRGTWAWSRTPLMQFPTVQVNLVSCNSPRPVNHFTPNTFERETEVVAKNSLALWGPLCAHAEISRVRVCLCLSCVRASFKGRGLDVSQVPLGFAVICAQGFPAVEVKPSDSVPRVKQRCCPLFTAIPALLKHCSGL